MEFKVSHGTGNQYWLTVNNNPAAFAMLCENTRHSAKKDPELVAACRLVKAAPKLLEALERIARTDNWGIQQIAKEAIAEARGEV